MNTDASVPLPDDATPQGDALTLPLAEATSPAASPGSAHPLAASAPPPRTRWAAIVWGLFFAVLAWTGIWLLSDASRREGVTDWIADLTPGTITAMSLLAVGVLVLIAGLAGLIRHAQRRSHP